MAVDISRAIAELREIADGLKPRGLGVIWTDQQRTDYALAGRLKRIADELATVTDEIETPTPAAAE